MNSAKIADQSVTAESVKKYTDQELLSNFRVYQALKDQFSANVRDIRMGLSSDLREMIIHVDIVVGLPAVISADNQGDPK